MFPEFRAVSAAALAVAVASSGGAAFARVGETKAQVEARYGKRVLDGSHLAKPPCTECNAYEAKGFNITVYFENGVSKAEVYSKADKSAVSEAEQTALLDANGAGKKWKRDAEGYWSEGGLLFAQTVDLKGTLWVTDLDYSKRLQASADAEKKANLSGF